MEEKIKIELTKKECELFIWLRKNPKLFEALMETKNQFQKNIIGSSVFHFRNNGIFAKSEFHIFPQIKTK